MKRFIGIFIFSLLMSMPVTAAAQLCFDLFNNDLDSTLSCADAFYFVDGPDGSSETETFEGRDVGELDAEFDGIDIFDDPSNPPEEIFEPLFSDISYNQTNTGGEISSFQARHRGRVSIGARDSNFQNASYGSKSRLVFIPFRTDGGTEPIEIDASLEWHLILGDPSDNTGRGAALAGAGFRLFDTDPLAPIFQTFGNVELELDLDGEPVFSGDFNDTNSEFSPDQDIDGFFDIEIERELSTEVTPGQPITLDTDTFGSVFTDGFESGDVSAWTVDSGNTLFVGISSPDPDVRFTLVTTGSGFEINPGLNGNWWNGIARDGEGAQIEVVDDGNGGFLLVVTFYSYDPQGNQIFLVAVGAVTGSTAEVDVFISEGGMWGNDFDPANITQPQWGTGTFSASSCDAMNMELRPNAQFQGMGYTDLAYDLVRLTTPIIACPFESQN